LLGLLVPSAVLAFVLMADDQRPLQQDIDPQPVVLPTSDGTVTGVQPVIVNLFWGTPTTAVSQGGNGIVTSVDVTTGGVLRNGDQIATVSGRPVLVLVAPEPMYRPLALGDEGPDVVALAGVLTDLGYLESAAQRPEQVDRELSDAIAAFNESAGKKQFRYNSRGRIVGPEFDYRLLAWLGPVEMVVGAIAIEPGRPWPAAGETFLSSEPRLVSAAVAVSREDGSFVSVDETYILEIEGVQLPLTYQGQVEDLSLDQLVGVLPRRGSEESIQGTIRLASPGQALKIAPSAIVSDGSILCVFVPQGDDRFEPIAVAILDSSFGVTLIAPDPRIDAVVVNPQDVFDRASCNS